MIDQYQLRLQIKVTKLTCFPRKIPRPCLNGFRPRKTIPRPSQTFISPLSIPINEMKMYYSNYFEGDTTPQGL